MRDEPETKWTAYRFSNRPIYVPIELVEDAVAFSAIREATLRAAHREMAAIDEVQPDLIALKKTFDGGFRFLAQ